MANEIAPTLRDRLKRLGVTVGPPQQLRPPRPRPTGIEEVIPGNMAQTIHGPCFVVEEVYPLDAHHGGVPLSATPEQPGCLVAGLARDESLRDFDFRDAAFLDTETTGLAGGTGTYAFLVGIGTFEEDAFRLRQFFLRDPGEEPAMVEAVSQVLSRCQAVVSFNGKAFDMPLLATRFTFARRVMPLADAPHFDLLFAARRLWSARLPSCALPFLEEHILGLQRDDDVPSWLIPSLYFDYLRSGNARPLRPVFTHNALDILSLVSLAARMCAIFGDPGNGLVQYGADYYSLGKLYEELGWYEESKTAYRQALKSALRPDLEEATLYRLSFLCKRQEAWDEALAIWQAFVGEKTPRRL